jgi:hypothetical protein
MQHWKYQGKHVFHQEFGYGRCTGTDDGNIVVAFDVATDGHKERSLQHTNVVLVDAQQSVRPTGFHVPRIL